jgi:hypothetical protein
VRPGPMTEEKHALPRDKKGRNVSEARTGDRGEARTS